MIEPEKLFLRSWATWEKVSIPLNDPGITVVRGRNEDDSKHPNFAGKSSLFNSIYSLIYGQHQLASRKNSIGKIIDKTTVISLTERIDDRDVIATLKNNRLAISVDGELQKVHRKNDERIELQNLMGLPAEMWSSTVHINGVASNLLLRGSSSARCSFLEKAFDLDRNSAKYGKVGDILSQMKRVDLELENVVTELASLNYEKIDVEQITADVEHYKEKLKRIKAIVAKSNKILGALEDLPEKPEKSVDELQSEIPKLERQQSNAEQFETLFSVWEEKARNKKRLTAKITKLFARKFDIPQVSDIDTKIARLQDKIEAHENKTDNCPVCGHKLSEPIESKKLKLISSVLKEDAPHVHANIDELKVKLKRYESIRAQIEEQKSVGIQAENLHQQIQAIGKLKRPEGKAFNDGDRLKAARAELFAAQRWEKLQEYTKYDKDQVEARLEKANILEEKIGNKISNLDSKLTTYNEKRSQYIKLTKRKKELEEEVELRPIYKGLRAAYSPNGMRLWLLQELLEALMIGLNENIYSTRDFKSFGYKLSRNRELILTASNLRGTYDLYMLSGAEGVLFTLNLLTVLLPMLPAHKRCSMLILDDMDAMCSSHVRSVIADVYLPKLITMVNTLFFLTPTTKNEFLINDANEWLVVKKNGISQLER